MDHGEQRPQGSRQASRSRPPRRITPPPSTTRRVTTRPRTSIPSRPTSTPARRTNPRRPPIPRAPPPRSSQRPGRRIEVRRPRSPLRDGDRVFAPGHDALSSGETEPHHDTYRFSSRRRHRSRRSPLARCDGRSRHGSDGPPSPPYRLPALDCLRARPAPARSAATIPSSKTTCGPATSSRRSTTRSRRIWLAQPRLVRPARVAEAHALVAASKSRHGYRA